MQSTSETGSAHPQYLTFLIAGEEYALAILRVREIIQYAGVTRIPRAPAWVRGVINLRGSVVPVIDVGAHFGVAELQPTRSTCIVVAELRQAGEKVVIGLLADAVSEVIELPAHDVQPAPAFGTRARFEYLQGMAKVGERLVLMLDVDRLLSGDEIASTGSLVGDAASAGVAVAAPPAAQA
jgi:purine-binding chemotaxis protein CheW